MYILEESIPKHVNVIFRQVKYWRILLTFKVI